MTEFREQDLTGALFERVSLRDATFTQVFLNAARMHAVDFTGAQVRGALFNESRMRGVELVDVEISGALKNVVVNGVDIAPLVEAELNRRMPERARMRPDDADGFREAWVILERLWEGTVARARTFTGIPGGCPGLQAGEESGFPRSGAGEAGSSPGDPASGRGAV
ncbi:pentapeptide repeat-containing protein, partial [Streptomyces sp. NPDC020794]